MSGSPEPRLLIYSQDGLGLGHQRRTTLLAAKPKHTAQSLRDVQADTFSLATQRLLPVIRANNSKHPLAAQALEHLKNFDGNMKADSPAPVIFAYWADELTRGLITPRLGEAKFKALYGKRTFRAGLQVMLADKEAHASASLPQHQ